MSEAQPPRDSLDLDDRGGARNGGLLGFAGRLFAALLVILIAASLALLAMVVLALQFGYGIGTPQRLDRSEAQVATLEAQARGLQTQVVELSTRGAGADGALDALDAQVARLEARSAEFERSADGVATAMADMRAIEVQVAVFATSEAGRADLLDSLQQRSARVERFLQRLSDIAGDTGDDLGTPLVPTPSASATPLIITATPQEPTPFPTATASPTRAASATPLVVTVVVTAPPQPSPTALPPTTPSATPAPASTATPLPRASASAP